MTDFDSTQRTPGDGGLAGSGWGAEVVKAPLAEDQASQYNEPSNKAEAAVLAVAQGNTNAKQKQIAKTKTKKQDPSKKEKKKKNAKETKKKTKRVTNHQ